MEDLPLRIKRFRQQAGLLQRELAEGVARRSGDGSVSQALVCYWETGKLEPRQSQLQQIADVCRVTLQYLLFGPIPPDPKAKASGPEAA